MQYIAFDSYYSGVYSNEYLYVSTLKNKREASNLWLLSYRWNIKGKHSQTGIIVVHSSFRGIHTNTVTILAVDWPQLLFLCFTIDAQNKDIWAYPQM